MVVVINLYLLNKDNVIAEYIALNKNQAAQTCLTRAGSKEN
jgi:hypothetical protein